MDSFKQFSSGVKIYQNSVIYCDMDGVLVDFDAGVKQTLPHVQTEEVSPYKYTLDTEDWRTIDSTPYWWYNLKPEKDFKELWSFIGKHNVFILSAIPHTRGGSSNPDAVRKQKIMWCKKWLGISERRVIISERQLKKLYAKVNGVPNILIDDTRLNIDEWKQAGGFPVHHKSASGTIRELKKIGFKEV